MTSIRCMFTGAKSTWRSGPDWVALHVHDARRRAARAEIYVVERVVPDVLRV